MISHFFTRPIVLIKLVSLWCFATKSQAFHLSGLIILWLKSKRKVLTLPAQRKQTPYASCPEIRKRFLSWYLYYTQHLRKQQSFFNFMTARLVILCPSNAIADALLHGLLLSFQFTSPILHEIFRQKQIHLLPLLALLLLIHFSWLKS